MPRPYDTRSIGGLKKLKKSKCQEPMTRGPWKVKKIEKKLDPLTHGPWASKKNNKKKDIKN